MTEKKAAKKSRKGVGGLALYTVQMFWGGS